MRKPKAHKLPESTREEIAKAYLRLKNKGASVSYVALAQAYHCTPMQVRRAVADYQAGRFSGQRFKVRPVRASRAAGSDVQAAVEDITESDELFEQEYRKMVIDIAGDKDITTTERVQLMHKLTLVRQTMQRVSVGDHLRGFNKEFMTRFVRKYVNPDATNDDIIKMIREVLGK